MRAVLDANVLVSVLLSRRGAPAALVLAWLAGEFELVVSEQLLDELARVLAYPRVRARIAEREAGAFIALLRRSATLHTDPSQPARLSRDTGDDYVLALAMSAAAAVVSGDEDLLVLAPGLPVFSPAEFLKQLA